MEVSGQLHALAALSLGREPPLPKNPTKRKLCHNTSTSHTLQLGPMCSLSRPQWQML